MNYGSWTGSISWFQMKGECQLNFQTLQLSIDVEVVVRTKRSRHKKDNEDRLSYPTLIDIQNHSAAPSQHHPKMFKRFRRSSSKSSSKPPSSKPPTWQQLPQITPKAADSFAAALAELDLRPITTTETGVYRISGNVTVQRRLLGHLLAGRASQWWVLLFFFLVYDTYCIAPRLTLSSSTCDARFFFSCLVASGIDSTGKNTIHTALPVPSNMSWGSLHPWSPTATWTTSFKQETRQINCSNLSTGKLSPLPTIPTWTAHFWNFLILLLILLLLSLVE